MINIIAISGPSGSGKTTLVKKLLKENPNFSLSISATSRAPREQETDGVEYHFLTTEDFKNKIKNGDFIEYEEVYNNIYYGTLKSEINRILNLGKTAILDIDVLGAKSIKKIYGDKAKIILITPPSLEVLEKRLRNRKTEIEEKIKERILRAKFELAQKDSFDHIVVNDTLEEAFTDLKNKINSENI